MSEVAAESERGLALVEDVKPRFVNIAWPPGGNGMSKRTKPLDPIARGPGRYLAQRPALALMFALILGACAPSGRGSVSVPVQPWYCYEARDDYCPIEPTELGRPYTLTPTPW